MPKIDLTGKEYPYFKVLKRNPKQGKNVWWDCQCHCGKIFTTTTTNINREKTKSCGCLRAQFIGEAHLQDLTGQRFGELIVLGRNKEEQIKRNRSNTMYNCQCSCGNIIIVERGKLISRGQQSCGCKQSIGELHIHYLLNENHILYKSQYTNSALVSKSGGHLKFDFAILDENQNIIRLIEFDGNQHKNPNDFFYDTDNLQENDEIKNLYAKTHNIPLVRLPYNKRDNMTLEDLFGDKFLI